MLCAQYCQKWHWKFSHRTFAFVKWNYVRGFVTFHTHIWIWSNIFHKPLQPAWFMLLFTFLMYSLKLSFLAQWFSKLWYGYCWWHTERHLVEIYWNSEIIHFPTKTNKMVYLSWICSWFRQGSERSTDACMRVFYGFFLGCWSKHWRITGLAYLRSPLKHQNPQWTPGLEI